MLPQARPSAPAYMPHQILLALRVRSQNTSLQSGQRRSRDQDPPASAAATASTTAPARPERFGLAWPMARAPSSTVTRTPSPVRSNQPLSQAASSSVEGPASARRDR